MCIIIYAKCPPKVDNEKLLTFFSSGKSNTTCSGGLREHVIGSETALIPQTRINDAHFPPILFSDPRTLDKISGSQTGEMRFMGNKSSDLFIIKRTDDTVNDVDGIPYNINENDSTTTYIINNAEELRETNLNEANIAQSEHMRKNQAPVNQNYLTRSPDRDVSSHVSDNKYPFELRGINYVSKSE
jgi:hypothetical protein